jgi:DNA-binding helix-hairpin-helix protein with protein kinase domain
MQLTTESGTAIRLGKEIGRGGEATVFEVQGIGGVVAKIYQRAPQKSLSKKLRDMVAIGRGSSELGRLAAWPTDLLVESASQDLKGFLMRRVDGHFPVHELYTPKSRHERFPTASWKFLVHAAMNVCEAFRLIHENGIVIGDVNHSNLLISPRATAFLIDCDSMGVNRGECIHPCSGVGIRDFLPPELQVNFCGSQRTTNHDLFGLAVILFQLLFGGRHPFTGMLRASTKGEVPECGEAIREGDFAYSRIRIGRLQPKAGWPGLDIVGVKCATLF